MRGCNSYSKRFRTTGISVVLAAAAVGVTGSVLAAGPAAANGPCGNLGAVEEDPSGATAITCVYDDTSAPTHLEAPAGVETVTVLLTGGSGGAGASGAPGADGGRSRTTIRMPAEGIEIWTGAAGQPGRGCGSDSVGGAGGRTSGAPSGGPGGAGEGCAGGGGGGGSFVMPGNSAPGTAIPLAWAGGGGGGGGAQSAVGGHGGPGAAGPVHTESATHASRQHADTGGGSPNTVGGYGAPGSTNRPAGGGGGGGYPAGTGGGPACGGVGGGATVRGGHSCPDRSTGGEPGARSAAVEAPRSGLVKVTFNPPTQRTSDGGDQVAYPSSPQVGPSA